MRPNFYLNNVASFRPAILLKEEFPIQAFSCERYEIVKNTFYLQNALLAASVIHTYHLF